MSRNCKWKGNGPSKEQKLACSDCLKIFFWLSRLPMMIQISENSSHLPPNCSFYQKTKSKQS